MREPRPISGARAPLFDRLSETPPAFAVDAGGPRILTREELRNSVRDELSRLLNTRASLPRTQRELAEGTVLDYGIPDLSPFTPANEFDYPKVAALIVRKVEAYEPRLRDVHVAIKKSPDNPRALLGILQATLIAGTVYEPVSFPLALDRDKIQID